ncbi:MAG: acetolactate synthase small subunit [Oscillospiraceae bacterium]|nr:acetolactate synthase small subunit [Oscillospiraceae bacterium]
MSAKKAIIALLVENNANVLSRVAMLFGKRGYNIDSLTVSETNDPSISRITVTTQGDDRIIEQIVLQTRKMVEVKAVQLEDESEAILRELLLVKVGADEGQRVAIREICEIYKASIVDFSPSSIVCELTGKPSKINGFLDIIEKYQILELCRTGVTAMDRGTKTMVCENKESHKA